MTTLAVVRKNGQIAIAADTLTKWGSAKESSVYVTNHEKIFKVGETYLAITGSTTFKLILGEYFSQMETLPKFDSISSIFRTWQEMHVALKERYFLNAHEDKEDDLETTRMYVVIANAHGIFGVSPHRTIQEFSKFYSYGAGAEYAMGALYAAYDQPKLNAEALARLAVEAAAEFDDSTGGPINSHRIRALKQK